MDDFLLRVGHGLKTLFCSTGHFATPMASTLKITLLKILPFSRVFEHV